MRLIVRLAIALHIILLLILHGTMGSKDELIEMRIWRHYGVRPFLKDIFFESPEERSDFVVREHEVLLKMVNRSLWKKLLTK